MSMFHALKIGNDVMYFPTSIPEELRKYADLSNLVSDKEIDQFKRRLKEIKDKL